MKLTALSAPIFVLFFGAAMHGATLQVGPGQTFSQPCQALAAAAPGDTILIDAVGVYTGDVCVWYQSNLLIRGINGRPRIDAGGKNAQGKGIWVITGRDNVIENIEFSGATVVDMNGAGIRFEGANLTIRRCYFHHNQDGILATGLPEGEIVVEYSEFAYNGAGDGQSHNIYQAVPIPRFVFRFNYSHDAVGGQLVKTRAAENHILYNRLSSEDAPSSYELDIPNGGLSYVIGNVIQQSPTSVNYNIIAYLTEGPGTLTNFQLYLVNNTIVNNHPYGTFLLSRSNIPAVIRNNICFGTGSFSAPVAPILSNNLLNVDPLFVNAAAFDYHLQPGSPGIDAGVDPGTGDGQSLNPAYEYIHPGCGRPRATVGTIDIGAFEAGNTATQLGCSASLSPPAALNSITLPANVAAGVDANASVQLTADAPAGGVLVNLSSSNASVASGPSTVLVPGASSSASFTINTGGVTTPTPVTFTASSAGVVKTATLTVTGGGVALNAASLSFTDQVLNTASAAKTVTLTNSTTSPLNITRVMFTGTNPADFAQTNNCGGSIAPGANCVISIVFQPTVLGSRNAILYLDDSPRAPQTIPITGNGIGFPALAFSITTVNFGTQPVGVTSAPQSVTLTNTGAGFLSVTGSSIMGTNSADFLLAGACSSVAPGASCTFSLSFQPAAAGLRSAALIISDNTPGSPHSVSLTGAGAAPVGTPPSGTATFLKTDTATSGTWKGVYGSDGSQIISDTPNTPAYVTVTPSDNFGFIWAASTTESRAPQKLAALDRIAACWYSLTSFAVDLKFNDANSHQVALYLFDWDGYGGGRTERVDILDAATYAVLDTRSVASFSGGQYLVWKLGGHVVVRITNANPSSNAVMSGLLFGGAGAVSPGTPGKATFLKTDTTTSGAWKGVYGSDGSQIISDTPNTPAYVTVTPFSNSAYVWTGSTLDSRAPQKLAAPDRIAACWYSWTSFAVDVNFNDANSHQVALYLLDWDGAGGGRSERVEILDGATYAVLDTRSVTGFSGGQYLVWNLGGHVVVRVTNTNASSNAVMSALLFGAGGVSTVAAGKATFLKTDTTTSGTWKGVYGSEGSQIISDAPNTPAYVTLTPFGNSAYVWTPSTTDARALQKVGGPDRIAACWHSWSSFAVDVNFNDANSHQVALYFLDWDGYGGGRTERVEILDAATYAVLDTRSVASFSGGQYLVWNLAGHVIVRITTTNPSSNAVMSGLLFGGAGAVSVTVGKATFLKTDTATSGTWKGVYGSEGSQILGDSVNNPAYVSVTPSSNSSYIWTASTPDSRALQKLASTDRIAGCWYSYGPFSIDLNFNDANSHQVALYFLDWDGYGAGRTERVEILDAATNAVLDTRSVGNFSTGQYLVWNLGGHVIVRITNTNQSSNAVMSGLLFGAGGGVSTTAATFLKTDTTTSGAWKGVYGADGNQIIGDTVNTPAYVSVTPLANFGYIWTPSTADSRAVQKVASADRIAGCWYSSGSFSIDLKFNDANSHQVALYLLDWDGYGGGRTERVEILDAATYAVLDTRSVAGFSTGQYLVWNLSGHVIVRITNTNQSSNAVMSGMFFR